MKRRDAEISDMHELMAELQGEVDKLKVQLAGDGTAELDQEVELAASARDGTVRLAPLCFLSCLLTLILRINLLNLGD